MKRIILILCLVYGVLSNTYAIERFSFSLALVTPSGKVDGKSYFLVHIKNNDNNLSMFIPRNRLESCCEVIYDKVDVGETGDYSWSFFNVVYGEASVVEIAPGGEYTEKIPLMLPLQGDGPGVLPLSKESLLQVRRVRLRLVKFTYFPVIPGKAEFHGKEEVDVIYSNWVDIKAEDFVRFLP